MSDVPNYWWTSVTPDEAAPLTEKTLRDAIAARENEQNAAAEWRAERHAAVAVWWRSQPDAVRESQAGMAVHAIACSGQPIHPAMYERLAATIHELGGTMP